VRDILKLSPMLAAILLTGAIRHAVSQSPSSMVTGPSQAAKVPSSSGQSQNGEVQLQQRTADATAPNSSNVIQDSVTVQYPYAGSVPDSKPADGVLRLSLSDALTRALRSNLAAISQSAEVEQARGERTVARSALLPQLNVGVSEEFERLNLRTQA
jgi:outer membrane protein TolC